MKKALLGASLLAAAFTSQSWADGPHASGIPALDHVFVIMMENHGYGQILDNPSAPFVNQLARSANLATRYFAVGHPSLTNYLEIVGGSNFGIRDDNSPDWHNSGCQPNIATGAVSLEATSTPICPISGSGTDAETPALDTYNEAPGQTTIDIDGVLGYPAAPTVGATIGDQLAAEGRSWKAYEESLPVGGADGINNSDGEYSDRVPSPLPNTSPVALYAAKHDPFAYFASVQSGADPRNSLRNIVGFDGPGGLYQDLGSAATVPTFAFIAPNQCNDQHGKGGAGPFCAGDPNDNGTQTGLNPALIYAGDLAVQRIVGAIKHSPAWEYGRSAIIVVWDENDYSVAPVTNQVVTIVDTNYGVHGVRSNAFYTHFSLLRSIEAGLGLPCLNHACDKSTALMSDLFAAAPAGSR